MKISRKHFVSMAVAVLAGAGLVAQAQAMATVAALAAAWGSAKAGTVAHGGAATPSTRPHEPEVRWYTLARATAGAGLAEPAARAAGALLSGAAGPGRWWNGGCGGRCSK